AAAAGYWFDTGGPGGRVGGLRRGLGEGLADPTGRQRVTVPGDGSTVLDEVLTPPIEIDGYHAVDLYAGIEWDHWSLRAYVNNVTDERAWSTISPISSALTGVTDHWSGVPIQPRTFGLEVDYRF